MRFLSSIDNQSNNTPGHEFLMIATCNLENPSRQMLIPVSHVSQPARRRFILCRDCPNLHQTKQFSPRYWGRELKFSHDRIGLNRNGHGPEAISKGAPSAEYKFETSTDVNMYTSRFSVEEMRGQDRMVCAPPLRSC